MHEHQRVLAVHAPIAPSPSPVTMHGAPSSHSLPPILCAVGSCCVHPDCQAPRAQSVDVLQFSYASVSAAAAASAYHIGPAAPRGGGPPAVLPTQHRDLSVPPPAYGLGRNPPPPDPGAEGAHGPGVLLVAAAATKIGSISAEPSASRPKHDSVPAQARSHRNGRVGDKADGEDNGGGDGVNKGGVGGIELKAAISPPTSSGSRPPPRSATLNDAGASESVPPPMKVSAPTRSGMPAAAMAPGAAAGQGKGRLPGIVQYETMPRALVARRRGGPAVFVGNAAEIAAEKAIAASAGGGPGIDVSSVTLVTQLSVDR